MVLKKYLQKEIACIKDDNGNTLDFVEIDKTKEIFTYETGGDKKTYNVKRDGMYNLELRGMIYKKVVYFYNVNNPMPLNFNKINNNFEPIVSPTLYNRMLENEILIKLNTLNSNINYKMILIIAGIALIGYLAYSSGMFGSPEAINATMNMTNITNNSTGNFTNIGMIRTLNNVTSSVNLTALKGVHI